MASSNFKYHPQFFTATILEWKHLLKHDEYKQIVIESLLFLKKEGSIVINAFVIMPNHTHYMADTGLLYPGKNPNAIFKIHGTTNEVQAN